MFIYGSLGIIQGMFFTYLSATLSTLEKQFGIKSKESAYLVTTFPYLLLWGLYNKNMVVITTPSPEVIFTTIHFHCNSLIGPIS
jgi:Organic Anion Transporter Polypeptide (OATP) family